MRDTAQTPAPVDSAAADLPAPPLYGTKSIAEVLTSSAAALGVPGFSNQLQLPSTHRVCVVLADGLGRSLLKQKASHTPFLRSVIAAGQRSVPQWIDSAFPSTTAASLASLGTGLAAGQHGMVGYDVLDPGQDKVVNLLGNWDPQVDPALWQPNATVFERVAAELDVVTVSLPQFGNSPMTQAALRGSRFIGGTNLHARTSAAAEAMSGGGRSLMYFYVNELDKAGHRYGCQSDRWEHQLEELDSTVKRLSATLPAGTTILLTGDHGMLDVPASQRIDYAADASLVAGVRHTAGEPRMVHLYLEPDATEAHRDSLVDAWRRRFGERIWVFTRDQAVAAGLFGDVLPEVAPRIGDIMIAARDTLALYDTRRARPASLEVVGQHGSLTRAEREVPLLCFPAAGRQGKRG